MPTDFDSRAREWDINPKRVIRANAVAEAIRQAIPLNPTMAAFEYGCGTGLLSFALCSHIGQITLADNSTGMLDVLREKIAATGITNMIPMHIDLESDPLPSEHFDVIYTLMTLHHVHDTGKILNSFYSLLNPGGYLGIVDLDKEDGTFHAPTSAFDGHNGFERHALGELLTQAGFTNIHFSTCFEMTKNERVYPLFLASAKNATRNSKTLDT